MILPPTPKIIIGLEESQPRVICAMCEREVCSAACAQLHQCHKPCSSLGCPVDGVA